ncbi:MAG: MerC domain-containing protein [Sphingomonadales bacterium]|nr:MAG: MerC domain-containing protein [Sphingomonadales bacterium]TNF03920.1 MAG: MerC domain-containing protein [Sphingomonadales bacterium]
MFDSTKNWVSLDRVAIGLSTLCAVHCVATVVLLGALSSLGHLFTAPIIHEVGLVLAIVIGALALGAGIRRHRLLMPSIAGGIGLLVMATALFVPHGLGEAIATIIGVSMVAVAHLLNMRADCAC